MYKTIKRICDERGLSIRQLEIRAGLADNSISKWKTCSPKLSSLEKVAAALDIKVETLIRRSRR